MSGLATTDKECRLPPGESALARGASEDAPAGFKIHLRFITGRCVATRVDAREQPEWPPHPGRLYMAMVAAHFETDGSDADKAAEQQALEWLATLPSPRIVAVDHEERLAVTCYVPVNDALQPNSAMLQSAPGMSRSRQSRAFPTVIPQRPLDTREWLPDVSYEWPLPDGHETHLAVLDRLCGEVIRVGHSSSLVMAWTEVGATSSSDDVWEPSDATAGMTCRIAVAGEFERLRNACRADRIDLFAMLKAEIESTKGKVQTAAKERFAEAFGEPFKASLRPPEPTPASLGVWQGYRRSRDVREAARPVWENTYFERDLLILTQQEGPVLNVERTLGLTQALRAAILSSHGSKPMPAWLTGHEEDGSPTSAPHAAFLALPYAGYEHADGHLMGLAIAMPKRVPVQERGRWLGRLLVDPNTGEAATPKLKLWGANLPDWTIQLEERVSPPLTLQNDTWTKPSTTWASVTPVVLDRFPKAPRTEERQAWHAEVIEIIKQACTRAGLPEPLEVDVDSTAWHRGVPRAWAKTRPLRGRAEGTGSAPLGDGFPSLPSKPSRPAKPQVHVWLRFNQPVAGPVILGAGRFLGYGLCKPVAQTAEQS